MRNTWRWFSYRVFCRNCGWETEGANGLAIAAQHHDRTGHSVDAEVSGNVSYLSDEDHATRKAKMEEKS